MKAKWEILHYSSLTHVYMRQSNDVARPVCKASGEWSKSVYIRRRPVGHRRFRRRITITVDWLVFADRTAAIPFVSRRSGVFSFVRPNWFLAPRRSANSSTSNQQMPRSFGHPVSPRLQTLSSHVKEFIAVHRALNSACTLRFEPFQTDVVDLSVHTHGSVQTNAKTVSSGKSK